MSSILITMETNIGTIEIELNQEKAPITVENFLAYVKEGFYEDTIFHRVIPNFMIQGGGFGLDGKQKQTKSPIKLESDNGIKNERGTLAMARTSIPDSASCQFFINLVDNESLDYREGNDGYAVFGKVVSGMDIVDKIASMPTSRQGSHGDWPDEDIVITKMKQKQVI